MVRFAVSRRCGEGKLTCGFWSATGVKARSSAAIRKMMSLAPGYMVRSSGDSPMISHLKDIADVCGLSWGLVVTKNVGRAKGRKFGSNYH